MPDVPAQMTEKAPYDLGSFRESLTALEDSVALLCRQVQPIAPEMTCNKVYDVFASQSQLHSLPVVDGARPIGLIKRHTLVEQYSRLYFRDIYGRKPITRIMERNPLVVERSMALGDLSRILVEDGDKYLYDGFIITERGQYLGMGRAHELISELGKRTEAHLYHIAHHDLLTGLPNRHLFLNRLTQSLAKAARANHPLGLLFLDLDHFKAINDTLGHVAGDQVLVQVAKRLKQSVRGSDTVARLGGDEFTVILDVLDDPADASAVAEKIIQSLRQPLEVQGREVKVSASIGISIYPLDAMSQDDLIARSDSALYQAKETRNGFRFSQKELHAQVMQRHSMAAELKRGLELGQFHLFYQPQADTLSGRIAGVEALMRWVHPQRGLISPGEFIPLAEECGMILPLGEWAFIEACRQAKRWSGRGICDLVMAVNISGRQFSQPGFGAWLLRTIALAGLEASSIELELTESTAMAGLDQARAEFNLMREAGLRFALDDFGTGYSSLSHLRSLPFDSLKIDRSFVKSLASDPKDQAIARSILRLAHSLNLKVIAEGVENPAQFNFLKQEGCDLIQGFLCSEALPAEWIDMLLGQGDAFKGSPMVKAWEDGEIPASRAFS
jgi:diguanylate cyclase (GGDEF)-like protein